MKRFILTFAIIALITSCKTQQFTVPLVIRDSISVTYRQGVVISPADYADSAAMATSRASLLNASSVGEASSNGAYKMSLPRKDRVVSPRSPLITQIPIRVDTVYIERWHSQIGGEAEGRKGREVERLQAREAEGRKGREAERLQAREAERIPRFYKNCTWGFWLLLLLTFGRIAFRIFKAIYLKR